MTETADVSVDVESNAMYSMQHDVETVPCIPAFLYLFHRVLLSKWKLDYSFSAFVVNEAGLAKIGNL